MATANITFTDNAIQYNLTITFAGAATSGQAIGISGTAGSANIVALDSYFQSDNIVNATAPYFTDNGLSFRTDGPANSNQFNIYANGGVYDFYRETPSGVATSQVSTVNYMAGSANTDPTLNFNTGSTVAEGGTDTIIATELDFNDAEQADTAITYTVTSAATNGTLFRNGIALGVGGTFTQADIAGNLITYTHNGGETSSAAFGFSVSDGVGSSVTGQTFAFTVTAVNDLPALTGAQAVLANGVENDPYTVTKTQLLQGWTDAETPAGSLTVTNVTSNHGGVADNGDGTYTLTPTNGYDGLVTFSYTVGDGTAGTAASLSVTLANLVQGTANPDVLLSTAGPDAFRGLAGADTASYDGALGAVTARLLAPGSNTGEAAGDTYDGIENLRGSDFADTLSGNGSANVIEGGDGGDSITGNGGSDTASYEHSDAGVTINLDASTASGGDADGDTLNGIANLLGSGLSDGLTGNGSANTLDGGAGIDSLTGLGGNDSYIVDNTGDQVFETAGGGGDDRVYVRGNDSLTSYALLAGQEVETLATTRVIGGRAIDLTGNENTQTLYGNAGANVLDGKGGADTLHSYGGADTFAFSTALGAGNVDRIVDFASGDDTIRLSKSVFSALDLGTLDAGAFKDLNVLGASVDADDRILYDYKGRLFYDADGAGGSDAVLFAKLSYRPTLAFDDFLVV